MHFRVKLTGDLWNSRTTDSPRGRPIRKFLFGLGPHPAACALLRNSRTTDSPQGRPIRKLLFGLGPHSAACALLGNSPAGKGRVSLFFLRRAGGTRLCGLASVRRDPWRLALFELGLLWPFVHLELLKIAQNGVRCRLVPGSFGGARRTLCASGIARAGGASDTGPR